MHHARTDIVDFFSEQFRGTTDHISFLQRHLPVFIQRQILLHFLRKIHLGFRLIERFKLFDDINDLFWRGEYITDILKEEVAHKAAPHDLHGFDLARDGEHPFRVQFDQFSVFVLSDDREEVEQFPDVLFSCIQITPAGCRIDREIVGKFFKDDQRPGGIKIKHISILFASALRTLPEHARILRTERCLHIERR